MDVGVCMCEWYVYVGVGAGWGGGFGRGKCIGKEFFRGLDVVEVFVVFLSVLKDGFKAYVILLFLFVYKFFFLFLEFN